MIRPVTAATRVALTLVSRPLRFRRDGAPQIMRTYLRVDIHDSKRRYALPVALLSGAVIGIEWV